MDNWICVNGYSINPADTGIKNGAHMCYQAKGPHGEYLVATHLLLENSKQISSTFAALQRL